MVRGFFVLLFCQLLGEITARALDLPVPGPVLGMAILVGVLWAARRGGGTKILEGTEPVADGLLGNLGLLFVPAGVGVIQYRGLMASYGVAVGLAVAISTVAALLATVGTFLAVKRFGGRRARNAG